MKKKLKTKALSILMAVLMVATIIPIGAISSFAVTSGDYYYSVISETKKTVSIDKYTGAGGDVTIPSTIDGYTVTGIGSWAFSGCTGLKAVTIGSSVTIIGEYAFERCTGLTSVTIGNSVIRIDWYAFYGCTSLTSVIIPDSVTNIGDFAFSDCKGLKAVTIGSSVTNIGEGTFEGCTGLKSVIIPDSVTIIGSIAFSRCTGLTNVTIPDSVTSIGSYAFYNTPFYNSQPDGEVYLGKVLYDYKGQMPANTEITIKAGTVSISNSAFRGCTGLKSVTIPDSVTSIGYEVFENCTDIISVTIGNSVTNIGGSAFGGCTGLTSIIIPDSVTNMGYGVFNGCISLTTINASEGNTKYSSIDGILYSKDKTELFQCPEGKVGEVIIPDSVTSIAGSAFSDCSGLTNVIIPDSVASIHNRAFYNTPLYNSQPDGEVYFGKVLYAYKGQMPANTEINIKPGTISISEYSFRDCTGLKSVTIPDSVISIGDSAFEGCAELKSVIIGNSVTNIGEDAFFDTPFYNLMPDGEVYLGKVLYDYKGQMPANTEINIKAGTVSITDSAFYDCTGLTSVIIPDSITNIGSYVFSRCTGLTNVTIPDSVISIGYYAFDDTPFYNSLPDGEVYLGKVLYDYKGQMPANTEINIKPGTISITKYLFCDCTGLKGVTIPESVTNIGNMAFGYYLNNNSTYEKIPNFTITGYKGSAAESYAIENWFKFIDVTAPPSPTRMLGDVNGDDKVTAADAILALRAEAKLKELSPEEFTAADVTKDGKVTAADAIKILRFEAKLITAF